MKKAILALVCALLFFDVARQSIELYQRHSLEQSHGVTSASSSVTLDLAHHSVQGLESQTTIIVEFSDFECEYCIRHATHVLPELRRQFVETGTVKYAFFNAPSPAHPRAQLLAAAAFCAQEQSRFWEMHDDLYLKNPRTNAEIISLAQHLGLNPQEYEQCLGSADAAAAIADDLGQTRALGVTGTPTFAIGTIDRTGKVEVQKFIKGAQRLQVFEEVISAIRQTGSLDNSRVNVQ